MRRIKWIAAIIVCVSVVLAGCGTKDAESVVKDLGKVVSSMESYKGSGTMTLHTGQQPLKYDVEVWYQKPQYYRIALTNTQKDITQIVLRNEDGVFVLTPRLNKSFRFQSDWPENQGQVYLYQTLVQSILLDNSRQFVIDKDAYVFDVMANYQNGSLARQKIWLSKEDYTPRQVQVSDTNAAVMVEVQFDQFEFGAKFEEGAFDMQRNMGAPGEDKSAMTTPDEEAEGVQEDDPAAEGAEEQEEGEAEDTAGEPAEEAAAQDDEIVMEPGYYPEGVAMKDYSDITFKGNKGVMMRFTGTYDYTLIQTRPNDQAAAAVPGYIVGLGHTVGLMSGEELRTLTWTYEGIEYRLSSSTLPEDEMIKVAQSVQNEMSK
ncbi:DUF4367 domain-containing protein [Paenibacillus tarimensis]